ATMNIQSPRKRYRAIWISDLHIGTRQCRADLLLDFLRWHESEYLYLVGDIIDGWSLRKSWFWRDIDNRLVRDILRRANEGTAVIDVPGNHDEAERDYCGLEFAGVRLCEEAVHETADGRKLLILHGDEFDSVVRYSKWLAHLGDRAYAIALSANHWL